MPVVVVVVLLAVWTASACGPDCRVPQRDAELAAQCAAQGGETCGGLATASNSDECVMEVTCSGGTRVAVSCTPDGADWTCECVENDVVVGQSFTIAGACPPTDPEASAATACGWTFE